MSFRFQFRYTEKSVLPCLKEIASDMAVYMNVHPLPCKDNIVLELQAQKIKDDIFLWHWTWERTIEQITWQALCDCWLHKKIKTFSLQEVTGVSIKIMKDSDLGEIPAVKKDEQLIKGEGLVSFHAVTPQFKMDRLIVSDQLKEKIINMISIIKNIDLIYNDWGFAEVDSKPRAIMNFYGPPGTGKTMAAHCIAEALGKKIIVANFAEIESKYVGDSPKNLENIFSVARMEDAVLFFDEADSFLGKRLTSISSSSDQAVNSLRSKLLQLLEDHSGIVVFCTNLLKNYDKAFESRILCSLKFELPDVECRKKLIRQMIPLKVPFAVDQSLDETALQSLADSADGFSGREIKKAVLQVLCKGAANGCSSFTVADFKTGFELMKQEIEALKKERGEVDKNHAVKLEKEIKNKLQTGDFVVQKKSEENNVESRQ